MERAAEAAGPEVAQGEAWTPCLRALVERIAPKDGLATRTIEALQEIGTGGVGEGVRGIVQENDNLTLETLKILHGFIGSPDEGTPPDPIKRSPARPCRRPGLAASGSGAGDPAGAGAEHGEGRGVVALGHPAKPSRAPAAAAGCPRVRRSRPRAPRWGHSAVCPPGRDGRDRRPWPVGGRRAAAREPIRRAGPRTRRSLAARPALTGSPATAPTGSDPAAPRANSPGGAPRAP